MDILYSLTHYFVPTYSNNHKAKILHSSSLILLTIFLLIFQVMLSVFPMTGVSILGYAANIPPDEIIRMTNQKRTDVGAPALIYNAQLTEAARRKGEHMLEYDYWAHVAPDGTEPWKFFTEVGYKYRYAGENLARDFSNPNDAIEAWMASPSHKENMLSTKYKEIGVAVVEGDLGGVETTLIVQLFGTQLVDTTPQVPIAEAKPQVTAVPTPVITTNPTIIPSPTPTEVPPVVVIVSPVPSEEILLPSGKPAEKRASAFELLISPFESTKSIATATTLLLLAVMMVDGIIVSRRKISRVSGRTFAHLAFLGMVLAILLIAKAGSIL